MLARIDALARELPTIERRLGVERWAALRSELALWLESAERAYTDDDWRALERGLTALGTRYGFHALLECEPYPGARTTPIGPTRGPDSSARDTRAARSTSTLLDRVRTLLRLRETQLPTPITVWPEARLPEDEVRERTVFRIEVRACRHAPPGLDAPLVLPRAVPGPVELQVELRLPMDEVIEPCCSLVQPLRASEDADSAWIGFELLARECGRHTIEVSFRQGDVERTVLRVAVLVRGADEPIAAHPAQAVGAMAPVVSRGKSLLLLQSEPRGMNGSRRMERLTLRGGPVTTTLGDVMELPADLSAIVVSLCRDIGRLLEEVGDSDAREHRLRGIGSRLAATLLPSGVLHALHPERHVAGTPLHIECDDPWVPWELLWVGHPEGHGAFLGDHFAVTRWLRSGRLTDVLPGGEAALVAPSTAGLHVDAERRELRTLAQSAPLELRRLAEVQQATSSGPAPLGFLHFACHGKADPGAPLDGYLVLDDHPLRPTDVLPLAPYATTGRLLGTCVFANACEAGIPGRGFSGHGGWARAFVEAGAAAFIGPSWSVGDALAASFAKHFYRGLGAGQTLGEAAWRARAAVRFAGDPDRLTFAVYASPHTMLQPH